MIDKTPEHIAADAAVADANTRLATARTAHQTVANDLRQALATKQGLLSKSASGESVTAQEVATAEDEARNAEQRHQYSQAGIDGAAKAHAKALEALRIHEQTHFRTRHKELQGKRAAIAREADAALALVKAKLAEYDAMQGEFYNLRAEAEGATAAPLWNPATVNAPNDPLPIPMSGSNVKIEISRLGNGSVWHHGNILRALGHAA
jgi:type II secretory pathway component PulJ